MRQALEQVLADPACRHAHFEAVDLADSSGPWGKVRDALRASDLTDGIKASKVTKILHRKRPNLVPIFDSRVASFYGVNVHHPWELWPVLHADIRQHSAG